MSPQNKPTIVFCHGIWADGSCFSKVIPPLQADGYEVIAVQYSLESFEEDVAMVKRTLNRVGTPVLLVGHSYGGATITASGVDDRVAGLVYIGAVAPDVGETVQDQLDKYPSDIFSRVEVPGCFLMGPSSSAETFPRRSRSLCGPLIFPLTPISLRSRSSREHLGSRNQAGIFCAYKTTPCTPISSAGSPSEWGRP
jgi:pimeloyl-ACP methyl ester carboxylesterase